MNEFTIYHNPRCSKSRQTLDLLRAHGVEPRIVPYLETPPDKRQLKDVLGLLGLSPRDLLRKSEAAYAERGLADPSLDDEALLQAMIEEPKLIERPIVIAGKRAVLGRPPENVLELLK